MDNKVKLIWKISGIISILLAIFLSFYYRIFNENYEGVIDWWAVVVITIPVVILMVTRILIFIWNVDIDESFTDKNFIEKMDVCINKLVMLISTVLILPIGCLFLIVSFIYNCCTLPGKKSFKKLISKGFKYKYENRTYILTKSNIVIWVFANFEDYYISFDEGQNFSRVEESNLGASYDRELLKRKLNAYKNAHPVDKQRGDALPPISDFVNFLYETL